MNTKRGFLRLSIVLSITAYITAFLICLASIPPKPLKDYFSEEILKQNLPEGFVLDKPKDSFIPDQPQQKSFWDKFDKKYFDTPEEVKKYQEIEYNQAQCNLIFVPLISFAGVWSLWIVYFIVLWVIKGFRKSQR